MDIAYFQSRYGKGEGEYINCPMNKEEYYKFYNELINAERAELKKFEKEKLFDACMPIEKIAASGEKTMTFGPLKPKGLINPRTEKMDYAVVQLRQRPRPRRPGHPVPRGSGPGRRAPRPGLVHHRASIDGLPGASGRDAPAGGARRPVAGPGAGRPTGGNECEGSLRPAGSHRRRSGPAGPPGGDHPPADPPPPVGSPPLRHEPRRPHRPCAPQGYPACEDHDRPPAQVSPRRSCPPLTGV